MPSSHINEDDCFFFESEHLALRGNKDYCDVLKTLVILSAQREKLIKDFVKVNEIKKKVFENHDIVQKVLNDEDLGIELPPFIDLPKLPVINFEKYNVNVPQSELCEIYADSNVSNIEEDLRKGQEKVKTENPYNWSAEEQKKLEELLIKYPPEPIERRRFQKIANELGNRSVAQVASRIQKYFLKLYKAGLPIPGRIPKSFEKNRKSYNHKHQRYNNYLLKPTTFFPNLNPPVLMNDSDIPGPSVSAIQTTYNSSNYLLETNYPEVSEITGKTNDEILLQLLKKVKEDKLRTSEDNGFQHIGYKCNYCNIEPISGSRWHCALCSESVDFCTDCFVSQMYSGNSHPLTHPMVICQDNENYSFSHDDNKSFYKTNIKDETDSSDSNEFGLLEKEEQREGIKINEENNF